MRVGEQDFPPKKLHTREQAFPDLAAGDGCNAPQAAKESQTLPDESEDLEGSLRAPTTPVQTPPINTTPSALPLRRSQRA